MAHKTRRTAQAWTLTVERGIARTTSNDTIQGTALGRCTTICGVRLGLGMEEDW